ncbi:hypothetical protein HO133_002612 [Letharia lupina]|uniref:Uncharacterized protein n=1 Tax=Letharia lupina TaxID=560253 RepID=A0A8H6CCZ3_9LECA|nr:uncharacterized protein HO133_002612 [Letharia lupina]KAF6220931.1 hypothetical protein HO133_002612 [Letharia lupina]
MEVFEDYKRRLEKRFPRRLEESEGEIESLRIRLFHSLKEAKKYDGAEKLYHETVKKYDDAKNLSHVTVTGRDPTKSEDTVILDLKHSFAGMLIELKKFQEAEPISRAVWEKRKQCPGPPSEVSKESHRQLCSVLCAVGRHRDAENMHRDIYQSGTMDAWALENGDEVCQRRREQGEFRRAKEMQDEVWKERLKQHGPRDDLTIRSGLRLIGFLDELVTIIDQEGGTDAERRFNISHKQAFKCEIEVILRTIWDSRLHLEPTIDILDAGHQLGVILSSQSKFADAEAIFMPVWEGRKRQLGERAGSTMSTGSLLGKALYRQGTRETYLRAVDIFQGIWLVRQTVMKNGDAETVASGEDLAQAYRSLGDWPNAERAYRWIIHHKEQRPGCPTREIEDARWNLGQTLYKQGMDKDREAVRVLGTLYHQWHASSPNSNETLQCGQMLGQSLSTQNGRIDDALDIALDVFNRRGASAESGVAYLDSGRLYGSLLLGVGNFAEAERILEVVWGYQAVGNEEQEMRFKCGQLYGQALAKKNKYPDAKKILEAVAEAQGGISTGILDIAETRRLIEDVNRQRKEKEREKRSNGRRGGFLYRARQQ